MFLQEGPADTFIYMVYGFGVILGSLSLYLVSFWTRTRNLKRDEELLEEVGETDTFFEDD
jgi:hypothetical protein